MANDLRLSVIMQLADKAAAPLRNIGKGSTEAARALKAARDSLKQLDAQQRSLNSLEKHREAMRSSANQVRVLQQNLEQLRRTDGASRKDIASTERALARTTASYEQSRGAVFKLRHELTRLGVTKVSEAQGRMKADMAAANAVIDQQTAKLKALNTQQWKLDSLKKRHGKEMMHVGMMAGAGVAGLAGGQTAARPVLATLGAFSAQENASSQLKASMMLADGSVSAEYKAINELAIRLGDRLPGTTADFINMMSMLRRQGISAQSILGGTGEAAAYLGVQLEMTATESAEFAAKMQDATRTTERDMMGLMDVIQRTYYLGVDKTNMLAGFTKVSPVLSVIKKEGLEGAKALAPLLVMMDQTGMAGDSAGNAIRKVFQSTLDEKKLGKANAVLKSAGAGFQLNFVDDKGQFAGMENLFEQLQKIKGISSDVKRTSVIKALFGDDAETLQVLDTLMAKDLAGYNEVVAKMQAQADLRKRVDAQLKTLSNLWDAATGAFMNIMASVGATVQDDVKGLTEWLSAAGSSLREFVEAHPQLIAFMVKAVAVVAGLATAFGAIALALSSVLGPLLMLRFLFASLAIFSPIGLVILALIVAIGAAVYLIYNAWGPLKEFFTNLWAGIVQGTQSLWQSFTGLGAQIMNGLVGGITSRLAAVRDAITGVASATIGWFREKLGIQSPSRVFMAAGEHIGQGAAIGIGRSSALVKTAATGLTAAALTPLASGMAFDNRPPLNTTGARPPIVVQGDTITIPITVGPGMDARQIAAAVRAELDRRDQARQARVRAALGDIS